MYNRLIRDTRNDMICRVLYVLYKIVKLIGGTTQYTPMEASSHWKSYSNKGIVIK